MTIPSKPVSPAKWPVVAICHFQAFTIHPYLFHNLNLVLDSVEGFQDVTQCRQAAVVGEIASQADYLIAAHWGDVWLDDMGLAEPRSRAPIAPRRFWSMPFIRWRNAGLNGSWTMYAGSTCMGRSPGIFSGK